MIRRKLEKAVLQAAEQYPAVTITGPRQAGKTTLSRLCFPDYAYANLEDPKIRLLAEEDYEGFFAKFKPPVIIDEIQRVPSLLSAIQVHIDAAREKHGQFILTGSNQPLLKDGISQSLAGRTAILRLLPLSLQELREASLPLPDLDELLLRGFMPDLCIGNLNPSEYYRYYVSTYLERDIRQLQQIRHLIEFYRFLELLAGRVGQVINMSSLSDEVGVSTATLSGWLSSLEDSFVVFRLGPYFSNRSKQLIKSPKIYFTEVGLASYLLGIENVSQMQRDPLRGSLFENMVVAEAFKSRYNSNASPNCFFLRTRKGFEIDLLQERGRDIVPFEIKSSMTFNASFARNLKLFMKDEPNARNPAVVYAGEEYPSIGGVRYLNYISAFDEE